ncbi:hypothetical protein BG011_002983, partial [Mortierella polycephala]
MLSASTVSAGPVPKQCNEACSREYNPICGVTANGESKLFGNPCTFNVHNCNNPSLLFVQAEMTKCEEPKEKCAEMCTMEYNPICGVAANGESKVFDNPCVFNAYNCKNPDQVFVQAMLSECEEPKQCNEICTKEYNPVCGRGPNGAFQTFGNPCTFEAHNCKNPTQVFAEVEMTKCAKPKKCNEACTMEYNPVCTHAENGKSGEFKTFPNACSLSVHNCMNPSAKYAQVKDLSQCDLHL